MFKKGDVVRLVEDGNGFVTMMGRDHGYIGTITKIGTNYRISDEDELTDKEQGDQYTDNTPCAIVRMLATGEIISLVWFTQMEKADV